MTDNEADTGRPEAATNVFPLLVRRVDDIPGDLRQLAKDLEEGKFGTVPNCVVLVEQRVQDEFRIETLAFGSDGNPIYTAGLLSYAVSSIFNPSPDP